MHEANVTHTANTNPNPTENTMEIADLRVIARHPLLDVLVQVLWPDEDPESQWDADTMEDVGGHLDDYNRANDYANMDKVRCAIGKYFCPSISGLSYEAVDAIPMNFDFGSNYDYDEGCSTAEEGRWYIESHPDIDSQLEELDDEVDVPSSEEGRSSVLYANKPENDGSLTLTCSVDTGGYGVQASLAVVQSIIADLDALGIAHTVTTDDEPDDVSVDIGRNDTGWAGLMELFEIDTAVFQEDDNEDKFEQWAPMMNVAYPLPSGDRSAGEDWHRVMNNCTIVNIDGATHLALTGGGMDFTWEIVETYLRCGYWPPAHFAGRLPRMAGRGTDERDRMIIAACRITLQHRAEGALNQLEYLDKLISE